MANSSFSTTHPGLQLGWDSTSLSSLKQCPRQYEYRHIQGWSTTGEAADLTFGIGIHRALEVYEIVRLGGGGFEAGVREAVRAAIIITGQRVDEVWSPWRSSHSNKTLLTLVRSVVWYLDTFGDQDLAKTVVVDGRPAEIPFRFELDLASPEGTPYLLCGHLDRVVEFAGHLYVMDRKSTKSTVNSDYFEQYSPDCQMSLYSLAAQVVFGLAVAGPVIVDAIQVAVGFTRFQRGIVPRTPGQLEEILADIKAWIKVAEGYALAGYWPQNDRSCFRCQYRPVCNKDPSVREHFLKSNFKKRAWDPLRGR